MESKMKVGLQKLTVAVLSALVFLSLVPVLSESVFAGNHKIDEAFVGMPIKAETGPYTTAWKTDDGRELYAKGAGRSGISMPLSLTFSQDTHFRFEYKVSTEPKYDKFNITNGSKSIVKDASGLVDWTGVEVDVKAGEVLKFVYKKDNSGDKNDDACYLRNFAVGNPLVVTFHNGTETRQQKIFGSNTPLLKNSFSKDGKIFAGWSKTEGGNVEYKDGDPITITENTDLYAVWSDAYTVTFINEGAETEKKLVLKDKAIGKENIPKDPVKKGYVFQGWYNGGEKLTEETVISADVEYTAKWEPVTYKVKFDGNGGEGTVEAINCTYGQPVKMPKNLFTNAGYTFVGWGSSKYGVAKYKEEEDVAEALATTQGADVTLYAIWRGNPVALTLDMNYDTPSGQVHRTCAVGNNFNFVHDGNSVKFDKLKDPERSGHRFIGWFDARTGGAEVTNQYKFTPADADAGKTLYARWTEAVTVTFDTNGGSMFGGQKRIVDKGKPIGSLPQPKLTGKVFDGWYTEKDGGTKVTKDTVFDGDATIYARYRGYAYNIRFNVKNKDKANVTGTMDNVLVEFGKEFTLPACGFTYPQHKCIGWTNNSISENPEYKPQGKIKREWDEYENEDKENFDLYAVWGEDIFAGAFEEIEKKIPGEDGVKTVGDLGLHKMGNRYTVSYESSNKEVIDDTGNVLSIPYAEKTEVKLTATVTDTADGETKTKDYTITLYSTKYAEDKEKEKKDKEAAEAVEAKINELPEELTLEDEEKVVEARSAYDALTDEQKALVSKAALDKLEGCESVISAIKEKKAEAEEIDKRIKEFPEPETLTIEDADKVQELFKDYNKLGEEGQSFVSDEAKKKMEALVNRVLELYKEKKEAEKKAKKDKAAAASIEDEISILPDVENLKLDDEEEVNDVSATYEGLTEDQKALVRDEFKKKLENVKEKMVLLKKEKAEADKKKEADRIEAEKREAEAKKAKEEADRKAREDAAKKAAEDAKKQDVKDTAKKPGTKDSKNEGKTSVGKSALKLKGRLSGRKIKLSWNRVKGAAGYELYMVKVKKNKKGGKLRLVKVLKKSRIRNWKLLKYRGKKLNSTGAYLLRIKAFKYESGKKVYLAQSNRIRVAGKK